MSSRYADFASNRQSRIRDIQNSEMSNEEKRRAISAIMMEKPNENTSFGSIEPFNNDENLTCSHYPNKKCSRLKFPCCLTTDCCVKCHILNRDCHETVVETIRCNECSTEQPPSNRCIQCNIQFDNNFCGICNIWSSHNIKHCNKCNRCIILDIDTETPIHCDRCNLCYTNFGYNSHTCRSYIDNNPCCVLCSENIFCSPENPITIQKCGHYFHLSCLKGLVLNNGYKCPVCRKCVCDMTDMFDNFRYRIKAEPLLSGTPTIASVNDIFLTPDENRFRVTHVMKQFNFIVCKGITTDAFGNTKEEVYGLNELSINNKVNILCYDCGSMSRTLYHYVGLECTNCLSFNTIKV